MRIYYFGCESKERKGHFLHMPWQPGYQRMGAGRERREELPWDDGMLDSGLAPNDPRQRQGICRLTTVVTDAGTWTALAFWDRSGDSRGNSNSAIIAEGEYTHDEMVALFQEHFPVVWERVTAEMELKAA